MIVTDTGIYVQGIRESMPVDDEDSSGKRLEIRDDEAPAVPAVVLEFGIGTCLKLVPGEKSTFPPSFPVRVCFWNSLSRSSGGTGI